MAVAVVLLLLVVGLAVRWRWGRRIGPYRIIDIAGQGAMGTVYRVRGPDGEVRALKVPAAGVELAPDILPRFRREARIAAELRHPHIVSVLDATADYLVMEWCEGAPLQSCGPFSISSSMAIIAQVLEALDYLHAQGVVHRDLNPNNIMLDASGNVRLMDFGLARRHDSSAITGHGEMLGSIMYLSPAMLRSDSHRGDEASDRYAAGVCLYWMLSGRLPYPPGRLQDVLMQKLSEPPRPLPPDIPPPVAEFCMALLQGRPTSLPRWSNDRPV